MKRGVAVALALVGLLSSILFASGPWLRVTYSFDQQKRTATFSGFEAEPTLGALLSVAGLLVVLSLWLRGRALLIIAVGSALEAALCIWLAANSGLSGQVSMAVEKASGLTGTDAISAITPINRLAFGIATSLFLAGMLASCFLTAKYRSDRSSRTRFSRSGTNKVGENRVSSKDNALDIWDSQRP